MADGLGTTLAGFGGGSGTTTYGENIGVMAATKVYSCLLYTSSKTASGASACRCMTQTGSIRGNGAVGTCSDTL